MKVNITGKGLIPGLNRIAPVYNQELEKAQVHRILNYPSLKVYGANGIGLITKRNIDAVFAADIKPVMTPAVEEPVVKVETPKAVATSEPVEAPTIEEDPVVAVEVIDDETVDEMSVTENEDTVTEEVSEEDDTAEEAPTDMPDVTDEAKPQYTGNKKNRKKNHYNNNKA